MKAKLFNKLAALAGLSVLALPLLAAQPQADTATQQAIVSKLQQKKQFRAVSAAVKQGVVTLEGSVERLKDKLDLEKQVRSAAHGAKVSDLVEVSSSVPDAQLQAKLAKSLAYDRVGYWNVFNVVQLGVNKGVVTLAGEVRTLQDKSSALALVAQTPGVKDVVDRLTVSPTSMFDDDIRLRAARAIYGDPVLARYAMDPQAPIRILVHNGKVGLYGTVDSPLDKQVAMMRASSVFGAFAVENHLQTPADVAR